MMKFSFTRFYQIVAYGISMTAWLAFFVVIFITQKNNEADDVGQSATVENTAPTVDSVTTAITSGGEDQSAISLIENGVRTVYIYGTATDNNGCEDVNNPLRWTIKIFPMYQSTGFGCTLDKNDCYNSTIPTLTGCNGVGDLNLQYEATADLYSFANATDSGSSYAASSWTSDVFLQDDAGAGAYGQDFWDLNSLIALDVTASVTFGVVSLGQDSSEQNIIFTNTGNRPIDATMVPSGDFICDGVGSQNIPISNLHIDFDSGFNFSVSDYILTDDSTLLDMSLGQRVDDSTAKTKTIYLKLEMPTTGVRGRCTSTITFTARTE